MKSRMSKNKYFQFSLLPRRLEIVFNSQIPIQCPSERIRGRGVGKQKEWEEDRRELGGITSLSWIGGSLQPALQKQDVKQLWFGFLLPVTRCKASWVL